MTKIFKHTSDEMKYSYYLNINNRINVTPNHQLFVNGEWKEAEKIKVGDLLEGINKPIIVKSINKVYKKVPTYNIEVSGATKDLCGH